MELVIATGNVHKLREYKAILKQLLPGIDLLSLRDFPDYSSPQETGSSFEENARSKASHAASVLNAWVIADDSGLIVPALSGRPGIYSARYAGEGATDKDNRKKLLSEMENLEDERRQAFFECWIAIASPEGVQKSVGATVEGHILQEERGGRGFGYDPLFLKNDYNKTFAELSEEIKNRISHRRKALDKLLPFLESLQLAMK